ADYVDEKFGMPTVVDIIAELDKPGRDPRPVFKTAQFQEGVEKISDLNPGMTLEGTITNVTNFGAFVDVGVHQDGLVHISALSHTYVKDSREVVKAGDIVQVKVMEVDVPRKRIALSMRLDDTPGGKTSGADSSTKKTHNQNRHLQRGNGASAPSGAGTMAALFEQAKKKQK
ncbi:MAG: hypothetical protein ACI9Y1_003272, partial [Lentisphaeria bacterium]